MSLCNHAKPGGRCENACIYIECPNEVMAEQLAVNAHTTERPLPQDQIPQRHLTGAELAGVIGTITEALNAAPNYTLHEGDIATVLRDHDIGRTQTRAILRDLARAKQLMRNGTERWRLMTGTRAEALRTQGPMTPRETAVLQAMRANQRHTFHELHNASKDLLTTAADTRAALQRLRTRLLVVGHAGDYWSIRP